MESEITVDLEQCKVFTGNNDEFSFEIDGFARYCLLNGMDRLDFLLAEQPAITAYEEAHGR